VSAWDKMPPLERKLEMKRRALVRRRNNRIRKRERLEAAAVDELAESEGSALAFPRGLRVQTDGS